MAALTILATGKIYSDPSGGSRATPDRGLAIAIPSEPDRFITIPLEPWVPCVKADVEEIVKALEVLRSYVSTSAEERRGYAVNGVLRSPAQALRAQAEAIEKKDREIEEADKVLSRWRARLEELK